MALLKETCQRWNCVGWFKKTSFNLCNFCPARCNVGRQEWLKESGMWEIRHINNSGGTKNISTAVTRLSHAVSVQGEDEEKADSLSAWAMYRNRCRAITSTISRARGLDQNYRKQITNHRAMWRRSQTPRLIRLWEQMKGSMCVMFMNTNPCSPGG